MNIFSRLIHSIELFKHYKTVYFWKGKKIGHLLKNKENHRWNILFQHFPMFTENFVFKIGMNIFSRLAHSIELFQRYKSTSFSKEKKNWPFLPEEGKLLLKYNFSTFSSSFLKIFSWNIVIHSAIVINRWVSVRSTFCHQNIVSKKWVKMSFGWYSGEKLRFYGIVTRFSDYFATGHIVVHF